MKKRATSLLLTLFLLLLGFNTAFAAPSCSTTFSKTNFAPKTTGATYYELNEVLFSEGISTEMSAALNFVKDTNPARGKYTVSGNKLSLGCVKNGSLMSITIPNLKSGKTYSISITGSVRLRAKESDASEKHRTKFKLAVGNSDKYFENSGSDWTATGPCNMSLEFTATSSTATALLTTDYSGDCYILDITEIKVVGCYDPQIVSSAGDLIPKGYPCTFQAIGMSGPITWTYIDEDGVSHPLSGTGNSVTIDNVTSGGEIVAVGGGQTLRYAFAAIISCSEHADKQDVVSITFKMPGSNPCELNQIQDPDVTSGRIRLSSAYCYGYYDPTCKCDPFNTDPRQENLPSGKGPQEEHYVVAKSTQGMFPGWYKNEVVRGTSDNGFMIVNCGQQIFNQTEVENGNLNRGKICEFEIKLCEDTWYDFSAQVRDIDQEPNDIVPTNVRFVALGANNEILLNYPTGTIPESWTPKGQSFNTRNNTQIKLILYNNQEPNSTNCGIYGSDLGLDDIKFTRCIPKLGTFSDKNRTQQGKDICNDRNDVNVTLYSGHSQFGITDMIKSPYYVFLKSKNGGTWEIVNITPINETNLGYAETTDIISRLANDNGSKYQYTSVVAGHKDIATDMANYLKTKTPSTYDNDRKNYKYNGTTIPGCNEDLYAFSEKITTFSVVCTNPCIDSNAPEMKNYLECPTNADKIDLKTLIKSIKKVDGTSVDLNNISNYGELTWAKADGTSFNDTNVPFPSQGETDTYTVQFKQKDEATQTYCISDPTTFTVGIKKTIEVTVSPEKIEGCLSEISQDVAGRTFYVTKVNPEASPANDYTYTWKKVKSDGTEESTPLKKGDENFYGLPTVADAGKINLYVESKSNVACPSVAQSVTYNIADNPNFDCSISVPCNSQLSTTGIIINLTNISGSTALTIKRDGTEIKSETLTAGTTTYTYTDTNVAATATSVKYEVILGAGSCSKNFKETYNISAVNQFSLTSNATDIKESAEEIEYHICEGTESTKNTVTVTAGYDLKPGELFEWYVNDVKDETADGNDKNYTLTGLTKETKFKAVIVAEAGAATCGGEAEITIYVDKKPIVTVEDKTICLGESTSFTASNVNYDSYQWTPTVFLSDPDKATTSVNKPTGSKTYSLKVVDGVCPTVVENIKLTVNPLPTINSVDVQTKDNGERNITIIADGEDPLTYSLDNVNFDGPEEIINKVSIGWNLLYLKDGNGCKDTLAFKIDPIEIIPDKYFTPNGDNNHEKWTVKNLDTYDSYIVEIFDRYGKRLYIKRVGSFNIGGASDEDVSQAFEGWDGIYNGHPMPSDDYWYLITVEEIRKQYTGHFTLKR